MERAQGRSSSCGLITFIKTAHELGLSRPGGLLHAGFLAERAEQAALSLAEHKCSDAGLFLALLLLALPVQESTTTEAVSGSEDINYDRVVTKTLKHQRYAGSELVVFRS